ncbi:MAG TPA: TrmB family transcriptional regulator [Nitrosopumilus sp.]|nr:TrmB family transcriptional regulator [Thermoproteota archaeon]HJJ23112.1 TrmB family transcriptional regulator [Nitrosopumilus sp.]
MSKVENHSSQASLFTDDTDSFVNEYRESLEKIQLQLSSFGLTSNQCKVYIFLGKYGSRTAPGISKVLKLPRTETYKILAALQKKGIVSASFQHPIQFSAMSLTDAVHSLINTEKTRIKKLENQKSELNQLWDNIPEFHNKIEKIAESRFQILQGENQIHSKINDMIINSKKEFLIIGSEKDFLQFYQANTLEQLDKSPVKLEVLTNSSDKTLYVFDEIDRTNVKKLPASINGELCFVVKDNDEVLFYMKNYESGKENVSAFWTNSTAMIYSKKLLFSSLWAKSKSIPL